MSYVVSEVYEVFIAVVTVVLLASLFTGAVEGQGRAQQPSAQASSESPGTTDAADQSTVGREGAANARPAEGEFPASGCTAAAVAARRQARGAAPMDD